MHDGAIIIVNNIIYAANVRIELEEGAQYGDKFGGRHSAAISASKQTDATVIVLSEEKKIMRFFEHGKEIKNKEVNFNH